MLTENEYNQIVAGIDLASIYYGEYVVNVEKLKEFLKTFVDDKPVIINSPLYRTPIDMSKTTGVGVDPQYTKDGLYTTNITPPEHRSIRSINE